jgi:hypothetical protein
VVNKRMKPGQALKVIRRSARKANLRVEKAPERDRGSHENYRLIDSAGTEVGVFGLTRHQREMSWKVMRGIGDGLAKAFGDDHWMEK